MAAKRSRASTSDANLLQEAKLVLQLGRKNLKALLALDAESKVKAVTKESLAAFEKAIRGFETVGRVKSGKAAVSKGATNKEAQRRAALSALMTDLRDKVKRRAREDKTLQAALGVGKKLTSKSTKDLLQAADDIAGAMEDHAEELAHIGIAAKQKAALLAAREALSAADVGQNDALDARRGATAQKGVLRKAIERAISIVRGAAKSLPGVRASGARAKAKPFGTRAAPARARKKKKPAAAGASSGSSAASSGA